METATEDKTSLHIRRFYKAPVATVYAAWTDPEQVKHWMGPSDDFGEAEVTSEVRVGGRYRIVMHAPSGEIHRVAHCRVLDALLGASPPGALGWDADFTVVVARRGVSPRSESSACKCSSAARAVRPTRWM